MGRFNWDWSGEGPPDEAYSRITEPERFKPLHDWALEAAERLQTEYEVILEEGTGIDAELEQRSTLVRPTMKLTPREESSAPITIAFTDFPSLKVRVGRWVIERFPSCGCDACDEMPEEEFEIFSELLSDVVAGRFWESMRLQPGGDGWSSRKFWSEEECRSSGGSWVPRAEAARILDGEAEIVLDWLPWQRKLDDTASC